MWLIEQETLERMSSAILAGVSPTADQMLAMSTEVSGGSPKNISIVGGTASISVIGVLTDAPDFFARIFGGSGGNTVYGDIISALAAADANPEVENAELMIDSPGGTAGAAWQATMDAVHAFSKPIKAVVRGRANSAAYGIAAMADEIIALNALTSVGSIGVATSMQVDENIVDIASSNAPAKRPDVTTAAGKKIVVAELDAVESQFVSMVSKGRGTTDADVKKNFGRGATVLAADALSRGMIDGIVAQSGNKAVVRQPSAISALGHNKGGQAMDLATFKAEHPAIFAEAVQLGASDEKERVGAHLTLAEAAGEDGLKIAVEYIGNGEACGQGAQARYMAAGMKNSTLAVHAAGDKATGAALEGTAGAETLAKNEPTFDDKIVDSLEASMGIEKVV